MLIRGVKGLFPCVKCHCPNAKQASVGKFWPVRKWQEVEKVVLDESMTATAKEAILKGMGTRDVYVCSSPSFHDHAVKFVFFRAHFGISRIPILIRRLPLTDCTSTQVANSATICGQSFRKQWTIQSASLNLRSTISA